MTTKNKFTKIQERKIYEVGRKIENARRARRLTIRAAARQTVTSSPTGHLTDATWRRIEKGSVPTGLGPIIYKPTAETLVAVADVVGLDGNELCREIGLEPPPQVVREATIEAYGRRSGLDAIREVDDLKRLVRSLQERLERLEQDRLQ